jgi:AAA family ATP:ADP antiporter
MTRRLLALLDVRPGESTPLVLTFLYIATVVASFLLAKPIRNGLFLNQFGAYRLVYVYVGVPLVLAAFVPIYSAVAARYGQQRVIQGTLVFFALNVVAFWYLFTRTDWAALPAVFYIWVNCYGIIAPVQAWTFANTLFDTRQAKRLFGLIGGGASVGAIAGGLLARILVGPIGGTVNLMLVLALLIGASALIVTIAGARVRRRVKGSSGRLRAPFRKTLGTIVGTRYLRYIAAMVFLVAIVTQWTQFQFSLMAEQRFAGDADRLTAFFGEFNTYMGIAALLVQVLLTGPALRRFGISVTILLLPLALAAGSTTILLFPTLWAVLMTGGLDQAIRFSVDKATFELLYLPIPSNLRVHVKATIDMIVNRMADGVGGVLLGVLTQGFSLVVFRLPGAGLGLRGIAAANLVLIAAWIATALALRRGYVETIRESIRQHRLEAERATTAVLDRSTSEMLVAKLRAADPAEVLYALEVFETQHRAVVLPELRPLLDHVEPEVRRKALAVLRLEADRGVLPQVERLLRDPDLGVRTEALLFLAQHVQIDPLERLREIGDFPDFSIRAGMVAFLARPGPTQNLDAAKFLMDGMLAEGGGDGQRTRIEAARLLGYLTDDFRPQLKRLLADRDPAVAVEAIQAVGRLGDRHLVEDVVGLLGNPALAAEAVEAVVKVGDRVVGALRDHLLDPAVSLEVRREIPNALMRIGTPAAQRALTESLLQADTALRFRIISSLNKLRDSHPDLKLDEQVVEMVLAAEILGHYRSYQILGTLDGVLDPDSPVVAALRQSMDQEVERIFRLMDLLFPGKDLHSAYFGLRSTNAMLRANAIEFLDNVLKPQLKGLLLPLLDSQVTVAERVALANRLVGATVETREEAVAALLASEDPWLQSCAAYAIGALGLTALAAELDRLGEAPDPLLRETVRAARERLERDTEAPKEPEAEARDEAWAAADEMGMG